METLALYLPGFAMAYGIILVGASSPGPAVAMLMGLSLSEAEGQGHRAALIASLGIATGSATINIATILGVGLVVSQIAWAMVGLKIAGTLYLLWLAFGAFKKALNPPQIQPEDSARQSPSALFAKGYLLQVTNPKAIAFWLAIAALGATIGAPLWVIAFFVASMWMISFGCHAAWALALSAAPVRRGFSHIRRYVEGALGAFFTFAALKLAISRI